MDAKRYFVCAFVLYDLRPETFATSCTFNLFDAPPNNQSKCTLVHREQAGRQETREISLGQECIRPSGLMSCCSCSSEIVRLSR